ncbi:MAG: flagellar biosynthetic protein FliR [Candidatus Saganbacteria bacterium]|uniref:Flagellar biosynthetic protein FliR n=1 Tax=Candidatus Saganbacteria bacterium TaxID=2575572 RepID=A0A833P2T4_UNCSA|nr:MAG: flagellar biosynthetic protein FliR [Candidatus Saganbacteria bacterium]
MIITLPQIEVFLLILARISGLFSTAPLFSARSIPSLGKTAIIIWITALMWFVIPVSNFPSSTISFFLAVLTEATLGIILGFAVNIIFIAVQAAGELIDLQMGLSVAQSFDPIFGANISIVGRFILTMALTLFVIFNGHHMLLSIIHQSFRLIPLGGSINITSPKFLSEIISLGTILWSIAIQLAGPIILIIFLSDFAFGIVSRVAPQVNVFMLGFQVKPALGLVGILFILPIMTKYIGGLLAVMAEEALKILGALR